MDRRDFFKTVAIIGAAMTIQRSEAMEILTQTINKANLSATAKKGGCGKCQASCQSACKTSCTVGNQKCANEDNR